MWHDVQHCAWCTMCLPPLQVVGLVPGLVYLHIQMYKSMYLHMYKSMYKSTIESYIHIKILELNSWSVVRQRPGPKFFGRPLYGENISYISGRITEIIKK